MSDAQKPPSPPRIEKKFDLYRHQRIGIPLIILIPILALLGIFGNVSATGRAESDGLELEIEYPTRIYYHATSLITISVRNTTAETLTDTTLRIDESFLSAFSELSLNPPRVTLTGDAYVIPLDAIPAGETRAVTIDAIASAYGAHEGDVTVTSGDRSASVGAHTFIIP